MQVSIASKYNLNFNARIWAEMRPKQNNERHDTTTFETKDMTIFSKIGLKAKNSTMRLKWKESIRCEKMPTTPPEWNYILSFSVFFHRINQHLTFQVFFFRSSYNPRREGEGKRKEAKDRVREREEQKESVYKFLSAKRTCHMTSIRIPTQNAAHKLKYIQLKNVSNNFLCNGYEFNGRLNER